jgi:hypothetical protein
MKPAPKYWMHLSSIEGHLAMWAVRQSPYHYPEKLDVVLKAFRHLVLEAKIFDKHEMAQLSGDEVESLLRNFLKYIPDYWAWNERKNGNQSPYQFVDRYSPTPDPDDDIIDLGALVRNTRVSLIRECERDRESDNRFDRQWKWGAPYRWFLTLWYRLFPCKQSDPEPMKASPEA